MIAPIIAAFVLGLAGGLAVAAVIAITYAECRILESIRGAPERELRRSRRAYVPPVASPSRDATKHAIY